MVTMNDGHGCADLIGAPDPWRKWTPGSKSLGHEELGRVFESTVTRFYSSGLLRVPPYVKPFLKPLQNPLRGLYLV